MEVCWQDVVRGPHTQAQENALDLACAECDDHRSHGLAGEPIYHDGTIGEKCSARNIEHFSEEERCSEISLERRWLAA